VNSVLQRQTLARAVHILRIGRNPKSGEKVAVAEKFVPHFKAGKELRQRLSPQA